MRMLTVSAIGLALALPLAAASAPARADSGDVYNQNNPHWNPQNDRDRSPLRADHYQAPQRNQRADADHGAYGHTPYDNQHRQTADRGENLRGEQYGRQQDHGRNDRADQRMDQRPMQQAQRDQAPHGGNYAQGNSGTYDNDHNSPRAVHPQHDRGDNSDRD